MAAVNGKWTIESPVLKVVVVGILLGYCLYAVYIYTAYIADRQVPWRSRTRLPRTCYGLPSHYYKIKGIGNDSHCLKSVDDCVAYIKQITGVVPRLVSFTENRNQPLHHKKNKKPFLVPNIVHYIHFTKSKGFIIWKPFEFYNYLSFKGADKFLRPSMIIVWGDRFTGEHWLRTLQEVPNVYFIRVLASTRLFGKPYIFGHHLSDALRISIIRGKSLTLH